MVQRSSGLVLILAASVILSSILIACANPAAPLPYPSHPITYMVPWTAGGPLGTTVQIMAPYLERELGQPVQVVFRPGASGQVGLTGFVTTARPDGYSLAGYNSPSTEATYLDPDRHPQYDRSDFLPVAVMGVDPSCFAVASSSRFRSMKELVDAARVDPESVVSADGGLMSEDHLALLMLQQITSVRFAMTHFEGGAPTQAALHGGQVDFMVGNVGDVVEAHRAGAFRVLGVAAEERNALLPDVPTLREQGIDMISYVARGTVTPAGTPDQVVRRLETAMRVVSATPEYQERMKSAGLPIRFMGTTEYESYLEAEERRVVKLLRELTLNSDTEIAR